MTLTKTQRTRADQAYALLGYASERIATALAAVDFGAGVHIPAVDLTIPTPETARDAMVVLDAQIYDTHGGRGAAWVAARRNPNALDSQVLAAHDLAALWSDLLSQVAKTAAGTRPLFTHTTDMVDARIRDLLTAD